MPDIDTNLVRARAQQVVKEHTLTGAARLLGVAPNTLARFLVGDGERRHRGTVIAIAHGLALLSVASTPTIQA